MGKLNKHKRDGESFGKCNICLGHIHIEYYFGVGDEITCYECGTVYFIKSKKPVKLQMSNDRYDDDDYFGEMLFED